MSIAEIITLIVALAALVTSCVSAYEMVRQSRNAVRPAVVVLEKHTNNANPEGEGRSLFLVNMGNSMAMNVHIWEGDHIDLLNTAGDATEKTFTLEEPIRTEIAVNRRALVGKHYSNSIFKELSMVIHYVDVNGTKYFSRLINEKHEFGRGHPKKLRF